MVGDALREMHRRDGPYLLQGNIDYSASLILGGQIAGEPMRLFNIYTQGNFIEATPDNLYFQVGESKYGKPVIDRVVTSSTTMAEAAKCVLISFDSTIRSNISVGCPSRCSGTRATRCAAASIAASSRAIRTSRCSGRAGAAGCAGSSPNCRIRTGWPDGAWCRGSLSGTDPLFERGAEREADESRCQDQHAARDPLSALARRSASDYALRANPTR
jgi:hypothetical protein